MDTHQTLISTSAEATENFGRQMADRQIKRWTDHSPDPHIFCLFGDLGSGKTTFTRGFAGALGITSRLLSPTFLLAKRYSTRYEDTHLYHLDIYRTASESDLIGIGLPEIMSDPRNCVLIEWAEKLGTLRPKARTDIRFTVMKDGSHTIDIDTYEQ